MWANDAIDFGTRPSVHCAQHCCIVFALYVWHISICLCFLSFALLTDQLPIGYRCQRIRNAEKQREALNQSCMSQKMGRHGQVQRLILGDRKTSLVKEQTRGGGTYKEITLDCFVDEKAIWHSRRGTQGLNTQWRGRKLDRGETQSHTHPRKKTWQDIGIKLQTKLQKITGNMSMKHEQGAWS